MVLWPCNLACIFFCKKPTALCVSNFRSHNVAQKLLNKKIMGAKNHLPQVRRYEIQHMHCTFGHMRQFNER